jgi:hypothetical protein
MSRSTKKAASIKIKKQKFIEEPPITEPPLPAYIPSSAEFLANKELIYARVQYRKDRANYYLEKWKDGTINVDELVMNTEHGSDFVKPK